MAYNDPPEIVGEVIYYVERLGEELLTLQSLEKMERAKAAGSNAKAETSLVPGAKSC